VVEEGWEVRTEHWSSCDFLGLMGWFGLGETEFQNFLNFGIILKSAVDEDMEWIKPLCDQWFEGFCWIFWISPDG